eukprot:CAMPEP_0184968278 /NCGR_PEP_ID=MMETSP1098-20130426/1377_1 /TAXON_ID=89044 /ORGANISM="Spumella elongata, Strain CCAP 955/1" /LENGTH=273 /DNA_ID=CAMNT_0027489861 /DNA_START=53 /DNA_END=874 /DNA_ORIENTATION=+
MSRISGLGDLNKKKEEEEKRNEFFAGGLDQRGGGSGLAVLGPPPSSSSARGGAGVFDSIVQRASNPGEDTGSLPPIDAEGNSRRITMYRNGFTVDDGPLRDLTSPESRAFIASLENGDVPQELARSGPGARGGPLDVHLVDKRSEDFVAPPPPAYIAFSGQGATLGAGGGAAGGGTGAFAFTEAELGDVTVPPVDEAAPTTTLQIKTIQGKKIKIRINQSASVLQLAAAIVREGGVATSFALSAGFPPKDVTDGAASVAEAGLLGAAITQKAL